MSFLRSMRANLNPVSGKAAEIEEEKMTETKETGVIWKSMPDCFPSFLEENPDVFPVVGPEWKKENEALVSEFSRQIQKKIKQRPKEKALQKQWEEELEGVFLEFLGREKLLSLSEWMSEEKLASFERETRHFVDRVRKFDGTLNQAQIWQALRNYFIYAMLVEMQGEEQNAGNPILAYSLLYPYTDNYIDDGRISKQDKERYNRLIAAKLKGETAEPGNSLEEKTCCLLDMILKEYKREERKKVAGTLLQLLEAQTCSIGQQKTEVTEEWILEISIWKGGTSVLADYLFSTGEWLKEEEAFYLKFGFLLQLLDDLQDVEEDRKAESHTLMTKAAEQGRLEQCVNRLLWFTWKVIGEFQPKNPGLKGFVLKNCVEITLLSAAKTPQYFSKEYVKALEPYLPFSLEYLKKMEKQQKKSEYAQKLGGTMDGAEFILGQTGTAN